MSRRRPQRRSSDLVVANCYVTAAEISMPMTANDTNGAHWEGQLMFTQVVYSLCISEHAFEILLVVIGKRGVCRQRR